MSTDPQTLQTSSVPATDSALDSTGALPIADMAAGGDIPGTAAISAAAGTAGAVGAVGAGLAARANSPTAGASAAQPIPGVEALTPLTPENPVGAPLTASPSSSSSASSATLPVTADPATATVTPAAPATPDPATLDAAPATAAPDPTTPTSVAPATTAAAAAAVAGSTATRPEASRSTPQSNQKKILIAEENAVLRKVAVILFERLGYQAHTAESSSAAAGLAATTPFDMILLSNRDASAAATAIRDQNGPSARARIIAMVQSPKEWTESRTAGLDGYISRPLSLDSLRTLVVRWLS